MTILNLIRPELRNFAEYKSGRKDNPDSILLDANESPYVNPAFNGLALNRYPEKQPKDLINRLATIYNTSKDNLLISRGSDEVIDLLIRLFCIPGRDAILYCPPTFGMYKLCAQLQNANIIEVPLNKSDFQLNLQQIKLRWTFNTKLIFICSPNNPTGNLISEETILNLCETYQNQSIIVVDEAYIEYANAESISRYIKQYQNLVVLRTLSKAYGLAGIRCGAIIANIEIIKSLLQIIHPYPIGTPIAEYACLSLEEGYLNTIQQQISTILCEKERMLTEIQTMSCIEQVYASDTNFLLIKVKNASRCYAALFDKRIQVRKFDTNYLQNCLRITIGLEQENNKVIEILRGIN